MQTLAVVVGKALLPVLRDIANVIGPLIQKLIEWAQTHQSLISAIVFGVIIFGGDSFRMPHARVRSGSRVSFLQG